MDNIDLELLKEIADLNETPKGAYNIRKNGKPYIQLYGNLEKMVKE